MFRSAARIIALELSDLHFQNFTVTLSEAKGLRAWQGFFASLRMTPINRDEERNGSRNF
jgi:hypothetical protein